ncbi:MAG: enoyl-CoA hydratase-related protein [Candidatus Nanopelagicales bacterium]|nr:enoyl-CoA hydratase-related protein [Candidatus Nanopelagicales bacterium]
MTDSDILLETRGSAVYLLLNRADKANALTQRMWDLVPELVLKAESTPGARVLVLGSTTDKVFSAGADVAEYSANAGTVAWGMENHRRVTDATAAIADCSLATIARIAGPCAGGAVALVAACDLRLAAENARVVVPPAKLGLVYPQADTARLVDLIGPSATKLLLLTAAKMDAPWALRVGLVDYMAPDDGLDSLVDEFVARISATAPVSVRSMKTTVAWALSGVREDTAETRDLIAGALAHPDHKEGTEAFLEGRAPRFTGC